MPVRGGATIRARCPLPSGVSRSITRVVIGRGAGFQSQPALGIDRRQLVEGLDVEVFFGLHAVDVDDFLQPRPLLPAARLHHAVDQHPFAEAELFDHRAGHERIGPFAEVVGLGVAEKAVAVGVHFQHALPGSMAPGSPFSGSSFSG